MATQKWSDWDVVNKIPELTMNEIESGCKVIRWRWIGDAFYHPFVGSQVMLDHSYLYVEKDGLQYRVLNCPVNSHFEGHPSRFKSWLWQEMKREELPFMKDAFANLSTFI